MQIVRLIDTFFNFYYILLILRIFLTWIPTIDWNQQPTKAIKDVCDVYLNVFRRFIPPINGLDFSPIIALIVLSLIQGLAVSIASSLLG